MIDLRIEQLLTMEEAAGRMRVKTAKTILDWSSETDYLGRTRPVVLETTKPGGKVLTSVEALARYDARKAELRRMKKQKNAPRATPAAPVSLPAQIVAALQAHGINLSLT
jgi:hypothetical protein